MDLAAKGLGAKEWNNSLYSTLWHLRKIHSSPTRRSTDLARERGPENACPDRTPSRRREGGTVANGHNAELNCPTVFSVLSVPFCPLCSKNTSRGRAALHRGVLLGGCV